MQPSSLVFVVVIGLWAACLTQSWMRRREHLQTARSLERYAEAMRVVERRPYVAAAPRSYEVSPLATFPRHHRVPAPTPAPAATVAATRVTAPGHRRAARLARGVSLALAVTVTVALGVLAVLGTLPPWTPAVGLLLIAADLAWLRASAARRGPRLQLPREHRAPRPATERPTRRTAPTPAPSPVTVTPVPVEEVRPLAPQVPQGRPEPVVEDAPFDVRSYDAPVAVVAADIDVEPLAPGTWRPVPVPPPTYVLKETALRPAPVLVPAAPEDAFVPVEIEDDFFDEPVPLRRVVGG